MGKKREPPSPADGAKLADDDGGARAAGAKGLACSIAGFPIQHMGDVARAPCNLPAAASDVKGRAAMESAVRRAMPVEARRRNR